MNHFFYAFFVLFYFFRNILPNFEINVGKTFFLEKSKEFVDISITIIGAYMQKGKNG